MVYSANISAFGSYMKHIHMHNYIYIYSYKHIHIYIHTNIERYRDKW